MELFREDIFFCKIHKKTPVPKSLFNKVTDRSLSSEVVPERCSVKKVFWNVISMKLLCMGCFTLCHGCSPVNLLHIFRTPCPKNTSGGLLLYPATSLKKRLQHKCFLMNFARCLTHLFYRKLWGKCFCPTEKYFTNKIVKNPQRKEKEKNGNSL